MGTQASASKPKHKQKNFAQINGNCKMAKLSDGLQPRACEGCGTVSRLRVCPFCGFSRAREQDKLATKGRKVKIKKQRNHSTA